MKTRYIIAMAAGALALVGCQREELAEPGVLSGKEGVVKFAPSVGGIVTGVKSGYTADAPAATGTQSSLTLMSEDGGFTLPMGLSVTSLESETGTKATLINETGGISGTDFATAIGNIFWVAAWDKPASGDPAQIIPNKTISGYTTTDGKYQKVMYRTKDVAGNDLTTPYWMTMQPMSTELNPGVTAYGPADDEYIWKKIVPENGHAETKTFYAYANVPTSATMAANAGGQTMTLSALPDKDVLMGYYQGEGKTGPEDAAKHTGTASIQFHHPFAAVKVKKGTVADGVTITGVAIEKVYGKGGEGDDGKLMVKHVVDEFTWTRANGAAFTDENLVESISVTCDGEAALVLPQTFPSKARIRVTLEQGGKTFNVYYTLSGSWAPGTLYTYTIGYAPGLLPGKFSVSETEYVQFSRGNLFCTRTGEEGSYTYEFDLERNQYDFRTRPGNYAVKNGVPMATGTGSDESGLFQYDLSCAVNGGDFGAFGMKYPIAGDPSQILNFGKAIGPEWSTLTQSQWVYFLTKHASVWCTVKSIYGYAFAPDDYDTTTQPWTTTGNELNNWEEAESAGVLFIPAAGFMQGEGVNFGIVYADGSYVPFSGYSWTSTANGTEGAYYMGFGKAEIGTYVHVNSYAFPERLVQKFNKPGPPYGLTGQTYDNGGTF